VGDHVVAIGSPLGLEGTVSDGIVSAIRRDEQDRTWIQTDAPVSHGNSGGPLLDMHGKVIGVITRGTEGGQNLNFAIPAYEIERLQSNVSTVEAKNFEYSPLRWNACTYIAKQAGNNVVERPGFISAESWPQVWEEHLKKAEQGDIGEQLKVSDFYGMDGSGVSLTRAAYWHCRAAAQGNAGDQYILGTIFRDGEGVFPDYELAEDWLLKSARQGHARAQVDLGLLYANYSNNPKAYFWLSVVLANQEAASYRDIDSLRKKKDEAASHLSDAVRAQVEERIRKWSEKKHSPTL
jgi:hypothetical protein